MLTVFRVISRADRYFISHCKCLVLQPDMLRCFEILYLCHSISIVYVAVKVSD